MLFALSFVHCFSHLQVFCVCIHHTFRKPFLLILLFVFNYGDALRFSFLDARASSFGFQFLYFNSISPCVIMEIMNASSFYKSFSMISTFDPLSTINNVKLLEIVLSIFLLLFSCEKMQIEKIKAK